MAVVRNLKFLSVCLFVVSQIRRYVYCDVVRATDMSPHVDISGIQVCVEGTQTWSCMGAGAWWLGSGLGSGGTAAGSSCHALHAGLALVCGKSMLCIIPSSLLCATHLKEGSTAAEAGNSMQVALHSKCAAQAHNSQPTGALCSSSCCHTGGPRSMAS